MRVLKSYLESLYQFQMYFPHSLNTFEVEEMRKIFQITTFSYTIKGII